MVKKWGLCIAITLIMGGAIQAEEVSLVSTVSQSKVPQNQAFVLTLTVNGAAGDLYPHITIPDLQSDFTIVSTSQSSAFTMVNGVSSRSRSYRYRLMPKKAGIFIIDAFSIDHEGITASTQPIRLVVVEAAATGSPQVPTPIQTRPSPKPTNSSVFLEASVSASDIFMGEQVTYSVKLYRRIALWSSIAIDQDDITDVWQVNNPVKPESIVQKGGQRYYELELVNRTIRPLGVGEQVIPPVTARFVLDPFAGDYRIQSDSVTITVRPLPEPKPPSFTGAIGQYTMTVITPNGLSDSQTFQMTVILSSDQPGAVSPPVIPDTVDYRVLSVPNTTGTADDPNRHAFDYVIIPNKPGVLTIPPIVFSYFSKDSMAYTTIQSQPFTLSVSDDAFQNDPAIERVTDIHFLMDPTYAVRLRALMSDDRYGIWGLSGYALAAGLWVVYGMWRRFAYQKPTMAAKRRAVLRRIQQLDHSGSIADMQAVFLDTLIVFAGYTQAVIAIRSVQQCLTQAGVSEALIASACQWIKNAQLVQFSKEKSLNYSFLDSVKRILYDIIEEVNR
jgi:hypothetical protein